MAKWLDIEQGTEEWLQWRRKVAVTASEVSALMGTDPETTIHRLWLEKSGLVEPDDLSGNPAVRHGKECEPLARAWLSEKLGEILLPGCVQTDDGLLGASGDAWDSSVEPVEIKCPYRGGFDEVEALGQDSVRFRRYEWQVKAQAFAAGVTKGRLAFFHYEPVLDEHGRKDRNPDGSWKYELVEEPEIFTVELTEEDRVRLAAALADFDDAVKAGREPPMDPGVDLFIPRGEQAEQVRVLVERCLLLKAQEARLEKIAAKQAADLEAIQAELRRMASPFAFADFGGVRMSRFSKQGSVNNTALWEAKGITAAEVEQFRSPPRVEERWTVSKRSKSKTDAAAAAKVA